MGLALRDPDPKRKQQPVDEPWFTWQGFAGAVVFLLIYIAACGLLER